MQVETNALVDVEMRLYCQECQDEVDISRKLHAFSLQLPKQSQMTLKLILNPTALSIIDPAYLMLVAKNEGFVWGGAEVYENRSSDELQNQGEGENTVLLCRNLRSGQKFYSRGNVVILGDVNPGAEIIAGGNIIVIGALRGMAHAGRFGNTDAVVSAYRLNPTQLRISDHITRPPDGDSVEIHTPEIARIREGKVVIEAMKI